MPWEFDQRDSRYIIIKRWIEEDFQDILFEHTRRLRARQGIENKGSPPLDATVKPWNEPHRRTRLSAAPKSDFIDAKDDMAESLLANCPTLEAAKEALEAAVRKRDAAAEKVRCVGGEKKQSVDELLGRYTTLFNTEVKAASGTATAEGEGEGETSKTEEAT